MKALIVMLALGQWTGGTPPPTWDPGAADNSAGIQAAYDQYLAGGSLDGGPTGLGGINRTTGLMRLNGRYRVQKPVWFDGDGIGMVGSGPQDCQIQGVPGCPVLIVGMKRRAGWNRGIPYLKAIPPRFAEDHRSDAFGKLDLSAFGGPGRRFGITSRSPSSGSPWPDHFVSWWSSPPAVGRNDQWKAPGLCLDLCWEPPADGTNPGYSICGLGTNREPSPWVLFAYLIGDRRYYGLAFACDGDGPKDRRLIFWDGFAGAVGVQRVSCQIDLVKGVARAWVNGAEAKVQGSLGIIDPGGKTTFRANEYAPFNVFSHGLDQGSWGLEEVLQARGNFTVYGLRLGYAPRYDSDANGQQVQLGGRAPTDSFRYGPGDAAESGSLVCYLDTTTPPTGDWPGRYVFMRTGPYYGNYGALGLYCYSQLEVTTPAIQDVYFGGFSIDNGSDGIDVGNVLGLTFDNLKVKSQWRGIGSVMAYWPSYPVHVRDCSLYGADAGYFGWDQVLRGRNLDNFATGSGRTLLRLVASDVYWTGLHAGGKAGTDSVIKIHGGTYASRYVLRDINVDIEGGPGPNQCTIYCERHPVGMTTLVVEDIYPSQLTNYGKGPMVILRDRYGSSVKGTAQVTLKRALASGGWWIAVEGNWEGSIEGIPTGAFGVDGFVPAASLGTGVQDTKIRWAQP